jgi:hypothetical protein
MDSTYAEFGTEVILQKNHLDVGMDYLIGQRATVSSVDGKWCYVRMKSSPREQWWWPTQDMILATDEPLLRK